MKKSDISAHLAAEASLPKADAAGAVDAVLTAMSDALASAGAGQNRGDRDLLREAPCGAAGEESPDRREYRHRRLKGAVVQGREGAS